MDHHELLALMPFARLAGVELTKAAPDQVVARLEWAPERTTVEGALHGGALMTLADSAGGVCAYLNLPKHAGTSTISSSTVFVGAVRNGAVTATSRPLHVGRSTIAVLTELHDDAGRLVASVTQTQAVLGVGATTR